MLTPTFDLEPFKNGIPHMFEPLQQANQSTMTRNAQFYLLGGVLHV